MFKSNYKIYDIAKGKYCSSGYRSKSTWASLTWVLAAAEDCAKRSGGIKNIEIHEFPVAAAVKYSLTELLEAEKEKRMTKAELAALQQKRLEQQRAIRAYKDGVAQMKRAKELMEKFGLKVPTDNTDLI